MSLSFLLPCMLCALWQGPATQARQTDYCIVGAGPGGLQLAYHLKNAGRNYVVYEKGSAAATFFSKFPRHRTLISINKRNTGTTNKEFNLRHDWNSLINDDEKLQYKHYSKLYFPPTDTMVKYLNDFAKHYNLNIVYNTAVKNLQKQKGSEYFSFHSNGEEHRCKWVIAATGTNVPNKLNIPGNEHITDYSDISVNPDDYEGKSVLLIGRGNSAMETANAIYGSTNFVHMIARSRVILSWSTHYVGDIRGINNQFLDAYQLKSLEGVTEADPTELSITKGDDGKLYIGYADGREVPFDNFPLRAPYDMVITCLGFRFDPSLYSETTFPGYAYVGKWSKYWDRYPLMDFDFSSVNVSGLYFAGSITHVHDYRKSSGGFIHGLRYTASVLFRLMQWRHHQVPWPSNTISRQQVIAYAARRMNEGPDIYEMFQYLADVYLLQDDGSVKVLEGFPIKLLPRLEQMSGHKAGPAIIMDLEYGKNYSDPTRDAFDIKRSRASGSYNRETVPEYAHFSNLLHPVFYYFRHLPDDEALRNVPKWDIFPKPDAELHLAEDLTTLYDTPTTHMLPLRVWLENVFGHDLRHYYADSCVLLALTHTTAPDGCKDYLNLNGGFVGHHELLQVADRKHLLV